MSPINIIEIIIFVVILFYHHNNGTGYIPRRTIMIVQHNMSSMNANRQLGITTNKLGKSTEKLSSGYRINRAGDDAAGLAISEKMRAQIRGMGQASANANDGISLIQTAEGALQESQNILQRMRELSVQAANDTNTNEDRTQIQNEITQLTQEVDRIANSSEFNTKKLLNGDLKGAAEWKRGNISLDGTFKNGSVSVVTPTEDDCRRVAIDDVVRLTVQDDAGTLKVESLNGSLFHCPGDFSTDGWMCFHSGQFTTDEGTDVEPLYLYINNPEKLTAGDVITISLTKMTKSEAASNEKEALRLQTGASSGQEVTLGINSMKAKDLGIVQTDTTDLSGGSAVHGEGMPLDVTTQSNASMAIKAFDKALNVVSTERAKLGAMQNRLEHTIANLDTSEENLQAAESRIRDLDIADEMTDYSKENILMQAGQAMLAQANQSTQGVLSLLK